MSDEITIRLSFHNFHTWNDNVLPNCLSLNLSERKVSEINKRFCAHIVKRPQNLMTVIEKAINNAIRVEKKNHLITRHNDTPELFQSSSRKV
jgi:hypothetical protein